MLKNYARIFGGFPKLAHSPLAKGDHPEMDTSELLGPTETNMYQSLIGALQWVIQLGRFDVCTAVMTMSRFRAMPRKGHLEQVKRIHGYLRKFEDAVIRVNTDEPDYSEFGHTEYDWMHTCYQGAREEQDPSAPPPRGKRVISSACVDANLYHDLVSGRSVTGILNFLNLTVFDWHSKLQSTVETATFGSEYVAARTCTEQIIDIRQYLRYLGVNVHGVTFMFGDNKSVVDTASSPHGKLMKRHNALSYHRTREAIAAKITRYNHIPGVINPGDILSKHWAMDTAWKLLKPLLFSNLRERKSLRQPWTPIEEEHPDLAAYRKATEASASRLTKGSDSKAVSTGSRG